MALQGTLDTFALPDVLRLLASTKKTGRLRVSGNRGTGSVWVDDGGVVATEATGLLESPTAVDVLFELLRYAEGSFTFEAGTTPANPSRPDDVEPLLIEAEHQLLEWREIEAVVPSMEAWVTLAPELPRTDVVIDADRWRTIVTIGSGTTVAEIGRTLTLSEVAVCRMVKDLVELGLGGVAGAGEAPAQPEPAVAEATAPVSQDPEPAIDLDELASDEADTDDTAPFSIEIPGVDDVTVPADASEIEPAATNGQKTQASSTTSTEEHDAADAAEAAEAADSEPGEADEVARQLASLSPKAARAVAAAARAETEEEREAALAEVTGDDDEPINRGLLLKFLSSVRT